jgi:PD-(D/E)XK nuclease family transposase
MLGSLDNEVIFKKAFTDKIVLTQFVKDILGLEVEFGNIETEKKFVPQVGYIDFELDVFAESVDKRIVVELQRAQYDYNFDRFMHYLHMLIAEQQKTSKHYKVHQTVYMIVVMTLPYKFNDLTGEPIKEEIIVTTFASKNLRGKKIPIYGHRMTCLNPNYPTPDTPVDIRDWLDLFYQSIHSPERPNINLNNIGIKRAVELIDFEKLTPTERTEAKNKEQAEIVKALYVAEGEEKGLKQGLEQGVEIGIAHTRQKAILKALQRGKLSIEEIAEDAETTIAEVLKIKDKL